MLPGIGDDPGLILLIIMTWQADKDGNKGIDQSEFAELWNALHGGGEAEQKIRSSTFFIVDIFHIIIFFVFITIVFVSIVIFDVFFLS